MRLVFLGPPGVGKGTQAELLSKRYGIQRISTGDIFREAIAAGTEMGLRAKSIIDAGRLVPDPVVIGVVEERLAKEDVRGGFVLDGFPRTVPQAEALEKLLSREGHVLDAVILFEAAEEEIVRRISGRLSCPSCQRIYHRVFNPPSKFSANGQPLCACNASLASRKDDLPETVKERLKVYQKETAPLVDYYRGKGLLLLVDATRSVEEVAREVVRHLSLGSVHDHSQVKRGDL